MPAREFETNSGKVFHQKNIALPVVTLNEAHALFRRRNPTGAPPEYTVSAARDHIVYRVAKGTRHEKKYCSQLPYAPEFARGDQRSLRAKQYLVTTRDQNATRLPVVDTVVAAQLPAPWGLEHSVLNTRIRVAANQKIDEAVAQIAFSIEPDDNTFVHPFKYNSRTVIDRESPLAVIFSVQPCRIMTILGA